MKKNLIVYYETEKKKERMYDWDFNKLEERYKEIDK